MAVSDVHTLEEQVLNLSVKDRKRILRALMHSLVPGEECSNAEWDKAWREEIARRTVEIDSGQVQWKSWEDVMAELKQRRASRRAKAATAS